jgi:hypothetical protein
MSANFRRIAEEPETRSSSATPGPVSSSPPAAPHRVHNCGAETCEFLWRFDCGELKELTYVWYE